jgi:hypothetical protein
MVLSIGRAVCTCIRTTEKSVFSNILNTPMFIIERWPPILWVTHHSLVSPILQGSLCPVTPTPLRVYYSCLECRLVKGILSEFWISEMFLGHSRSIFYKEWKQEEEEIDETEGERKWRMKVNKKMMNEKLTWFSGLYFEAIHFRHKILWSYFTTLVWIWI